ncbi:MAG: helix-turn-helix domain-containing protein [Lachnospiraceae bacterium]
MNRIKQLREERGMTQPELGKVLNVQGAAISKYENEKIPLTTDTIKTLSEFFGVSTDYLLGKTDDKDGQEQSEPEYTTRTERQLLTVYRKYEDNGFSDETEAELRVLFPEMEESIKLSPSEEKILSTFKCLNEDNQDIIIGEAKKLLREQLYTDPPVAAGVLRKASGK